MVMNKKVLTIAMTFLISAGSFTPTFAAENNDVPVTTDPPAVEVSTGEAIGIGTASGPAVTGGAITSGPAMEPGTPAGITVTGSSITTGPAVEPGNPSGPAVTGPSITTGPAVEPEKPDKPSKPTKPSKPVKPVKPAVAYKVGDKIKSGGLIYEITSVKNKTVRVSGMTSKYNTHIIIPAKVKYKKTNFKVVKINEKAFADYTRLRKAVIGTNVEKIGKEAFRGCSHLNRITVLSKKLTSVGKNALTGTDINLKITVYKKNLSKYKSLFTNKGLQTVMVQSGNR